MKIKIIFSLGILIFLIGIISALSINIDLNPSFGIGDEVSFNYTLSSSSSLTGQYIVRVSCPKAPIPLLEINNFSLQANQPLTKNYIYISKISENIEPQTCNATVLIFNPINLSQSKSFSITTNPSFNFQVLTCEEQSCSNQTKVFIQGNNIFLDYKSEISNPTLTANLTYPDGKTENLNLPTLIKAEQIGTYTLNVQASKENYQTISQKIQFGVIKQEANIGYTNLISTKGFNNSHVLLIAGIIFVIVIIFLLIIYKIWKRKK